MKKKFEPEVTLIKMFSCCDGGGHSKEIFVRRGVRFLQLSPCVVYNHNPSGGGGGGKGDGGGVKIKSYHQSYCPPSHPKSKKKERN